ncbi:MAG: excinuclease ABC subunit UvrB [Planctomycetota bacterium]|nr:excinuclease ABC subunit UvrB [Planctomycetota bacterium]
MPDRFILEAPYPPMGDQPAAIDRLAAALAGGARAATLLGVTGSGKTFTVANVVARLNRPTLVLSHNKTLAAQLYTEFKGFFPHNAVEYFVSYYDYYQPEAYVPGKDLYIEKEADINEEIDKLRLSATRSLLSRRDVLIVATVSAIYGLGNPREYQDLTVSVQVGDEDRERLLARLVDMQYVRGDLDFQRGRFRVRGEAVDVWPAYDDHALRLAYDGDRLESITTVAPLTGEVLGRHERVVIYPAKHFVVHDTTLEQAIAAIEAELVERLAELRAGGKIVEAQRLEARTRYDIDMLRETGTCQGIENYARHLTGRAPGERPYCLFDFFPPDFLCVVDESHVTIPQIGGMFAGDRSRKETLVEHGFRLPSALDNRPLRFAEWEALCPQLLFVSATPGPYEAAHEALRVEQLVRPTGIPDPQVEVRATARQVEDLIREVRVRAARGQRALVTTLTKRLAEDLSEYLAEAGVRTTYLHSELDAIERIAVLQRLRSGATDCVVGVNLLREGLDLPEVSLVAILDADQEGFLRSETSLIQTIGRAARHPEGMVILYADRVSPAMRAAIDETARRRAYQLAYNEQHGIVPRAAIKQGDFTAGFAEQLAARRVGEGRQAYGARVLTADDIPELTARMMAAAEELRFEEAARWRDLIRRIESEGTAIEGEAPPEPAARRRRRRHRR